MNQTCCGTMANPTCNVALACQQIDSTTRRCTNGCGATNQFCCAMTNSCQATGTTQQVYCAPPAGGSTLGLCTNCGGSAQPCCGSNTCGSGLICDTGTCKTCGGTNQICCANNTCSNGLGCDLTTAGGLCKACGAINTNCCPGGTCQISTVCTGRVQGGAGGAGGAGNPGMCLRCGDLGTPCCGGNQCNGALVCNTAGNCANP